MSALLAGMRVPPGAAPGLARRDTADKGGLDRDEGERRLAGTVREAAKLQQRLWAERRWSVLLVLQGVDAAGKDGAIRHALANLMKGRTVIAIAHRLSTLQDFDRIVVLEGGRIAQDGSPENLTHRDGFFRELMKKEMTGTALAAA